jgi:hypothetical protein
MNVVGVATHIAHADHRAFTAFARDVGDNYLGAFTRKQNRAGAADSRAAAGDKRHFAVEPAHDRYSSRRLPVIFYRLFADRVLLASLITSSKCASQML